jgi:hypothetical protein
MTGCKVVGDGETFNLKMYEFDLKYLGCNFPPEIEYSLFFFFKDELMFQRKSVSICC